MAKADAFMLVGDPIPPTIQNMVVRSEVHGGFDEQAPRKRVEVRYTEARGEGSRTANPRTNIDDLKKNRRIKKLEKELLELRGQPEDHDRQRLKHGSICSWRELSKAFTTHFITNMRKQKEVDSLMALTMKPGETLKLYSGRYWETYNEIDRCGEDLAIRQLRFGLPQGCRIRQSLTNKPPLSMVDLMSRIKQHGDTPGQAARTHEEESYEAVNTTFKEPIFRILPQIKDKLYFIWPPKMGGDPATRESKPYYAYHKERCISQKTVGPTRGSWKTWIIEVIHSHTKAADLRSEARMAAHMQKVFQLSRETQPMPNCLQKEVTEEITFTNQDLEGVQLPHSDALVVTMRVGNFNIKRILIDSGSSAEIMYEPLFRELGLGESDLDRRADPLYRFSIESVMPAGRVTIKEREEEEGRCPQEKCVEKLEKVLLPEVYDEVDKLIKAEAIREVLYLKWLSNTVVIKKKSRKWRVCIDFTDLNKACPKDPFSLPQIDQLVNAMSSHQRMSFLDAFQGFHHISLNSEDQEKTAFITPKGIFCYQVILFRLKNARSMYQRMVTKMFFQQIEKIVEVYVDDMVVKSLREEEHLDDLRNVFDTLRCHHLKLNASKYAFGVGSRKFLGFMLVVNQIFGEYAVKDERMFSYLNETKGLLQRLHNVEIDHIGREMNGHADSLASLASAVAPELKRIITNQADSSAILGLKGWEPIQTIALGALPIVCAPGHRSELALGNPLRSVWRTCRRKIPGSPSHRPRRLESVKGKWVEELQNVLWAYRTTPHVSTGETPFSMTYGVEAVIPLEVGLPTIRSEYFDLVVNEAALATELDLSEERRELVLIHLAIYQNGLRRSYEMQVKSRDLTTRDLVLRKVVGSKKDPTRGKLGPNWERPYKIASVARAGVTPQTH
uniref:Reverse transcriptase domain-containing protein n=1 Tax=Fagus sylvatica TaxID=28930 RepID=A0A2N9FKP4_FAGSY